MTEVTTFDLRKTYVTLDAKGKAKRIDVTEDFWASLGDGRRRLDGYLITVSDIRNDMPHWEMHPNGDEVLYLLSGKLDILIEQDGREQRVPLRPEDPGLVVPAGAWHRAVAVEPGWMMFVTWGEGTEHRPV